MGTLLSLGARALVALLQALPLTWVARIGRAGGAVFYSLDARHRGVARRNLELCFGGEKSELEITALARESFCRIGENLCCAVKTAGMNSAEIRGCVEVVEVEKIGSFRTGLGRWRIEVGEQIPTHDKGIARSSAAITLDINRAFEAAVRRDPANWFWVHNRWKTARPTVESPKSEASEASLARMEGGG
jgi:lauroyl/myristoyl acyltransferase